MVESPWSTIKLSKGQVVQRLETLGCIQIKKLVSGSYMWKSPTGHYFSISYDDCDADFLEGIVRQLEAWSQQAD